MRSFSANSSNRPMSSRSAPSERKCIGGRYLLRVYSKMLEYRIKVCLDMTVAGGFSSKLLCNMSIETDGSRRSPEPRETPCQVEEDKCS